MVAASLAQTHRPDLFVCNLEGLCFAQLGVPASLPHQLLCLISPRG
jgi:hypothetical protein